jgi:hypothetical protein
MEGATRTFKITDVFLALGSIGGVPPRNATNSAANIDGTACKSELLTII